jgi:hypothetical protein
MIELLLPCGFDTLEYSWVKATIGIYTLVDYAMPKKHQHCGFPTKAPLALLSIPNKGPTCTMWA